MLFQFRNAEHLAQWSTFSDAELGGQSTAALELAEEPQVGAHWATDLSSCQL